MNFTITYLLNYPYPDLRLLQLKEPRNGGYRAVVVVPTKELAQQICNEAAALCRDTGLRPHVLGKIKPDKKVKRHCHCVLLCMEGE